MQTALCSSQAFPPGILTPPWAFPWGSQAPPWEHPSTSSGHPNTSLEQTSLSFELPKHLPGEAKHLPGDINQCPSVTQAPPCSPKHLPGHPRISPGQTGINPGHPYTFLKPQGSSLRAQYISNNVSLGHISRISPSHTNTCLEHPSTSVRHPSISPRTQTSVWMINTPPDRTPASHCSTEATPLEPKHLLRHADIYPMSAQCLGDSPSIPLKHARSSLEKPNMALGHTSTSLDQPYRALEETRSSLGTPGSSQGMQAPPSALWRCWSALGVA